MGITSVKFECPVCMNDMYCHVMNPDYEFASNHKEGICNKCQTSEMISFTRGMPEGIQVFKTDLNGYEILHTEQRLFLIEGSTYVFKPSPNTSYVFHVGQEKWISISFRSFSGTPKERTREKLEHKPPYLVKKEEGYDAPLSHLLALSLLIFFFLTCVTHFLREPTSKQPSIMEQSIQELQDNYVELGNFYRTWGFHEDVRMEEISSIFIPSTGKHSPHIFFDKGEKNSEDFLYYIKPPNQSPVINKISLLYEKIGYELASEYTRNDFVKDKYYVDLFGPIDVNDLLHLKENFISLKSFSIGIEKAEREKLRKS